MNIYQMQVLFDQLLDEVATTRIDIQEFIRLIKLATNDIVDHRIDPIKDPRSSGIYIQAVQRIREELRTLVKEDASISITNDILAYPTDYKHYLLLQLDIDSVNQVAVPVTFDWLGANLGNPHTKPTDERVKFIEKNAGIELYRGTGTISTGDSRFEYIALPTEVSWDEDNTWTNATTFTADQTIVVLTGTITYDGTTYGVGEDVNIVTATSTSFTGGGTAQTIVNSDLPVYLHDEVVRKAVSIQLTIMQEGQRKQLTEMDEVQS
jgi:hypothetical protein